MSVRNRLAAPLIALALALAALGAGTAGAATPGEVTSFRVPAICFGGGIAAASGQGVLVRRCGEPGVGSGSTLENVLPNGEVIELAAVDSGEGPILAGPAGEIWAAANNSPAFSQKPTYIDRIAPDGGVTKYPFTAKEQWASMRVRALAIGAEGALWASVGEWAPIGGLPFETSFGGELVRVAMDGTETFFPVPSQIEPRGIALGPDGNLWFAGVRGMSSGEHHYAPGVGHIGRITPAGAFSVFGTPVRDANPEAIALGPDGKLWFHEAGIGTVGVGGEFGRRFFVSRPVLPGSGPEGDAWMVTYGGILRLTPAGQETVYPKSGEAAAITLGPEGDIWSPAGEGVERIVPGGPGIDVLKVEADRRDGTMAVHLACGGAVSACQGTLALAMPNFDREKGHRHRLGQYKLPPFPLARTTYSVSGETRATLTIPVPAKTFAIASRYPIYFRGRGPRLTVRATVEGGPTLRRVVEAPSFLPAGAARRRPAQDS